MKFDKELQKDVMDELSWEPSVDAAEIGVAVSSGVVTLSGTVRSYGEKWAAEHAAERLKGVKAVANEMKVRLPMDTEYDDTDIARAAMNAIDWNSSLPHDRIKVVVEKGWVTLDGTVEFQFQKTEAERTVRNLRGAIGIINQLNVKPVVVPGAVKNLIVKALERAAEVDAKKISVDARDSKVILAGAVKSWVEREAAEQAAWAAPGVSAVENKIEIGAA